MTASPSDGSRKYQRALHQLVNPARGMTAQPRAKAQGYVISVIPELISHTSLCLHLEVEVGQSA